MMARAVGLLLALSASLVVAQPQWCGKNYMASQPVVPPGGNFVFPEPSSTPLLALRCAPAIKPYLSSDAGAPAAFIVDAPVTFSAIAGARPVELHGARTLEVAISVAGHGEVARAAVPVNASRFEVPFELAQLEAREEPFEVTCTARVGGQTVEAATRLAFLPENERGSVTKMDMRTGALMAKPATGEDGPYETVFPFGFYTGFGSFLATNLSVLDDIKASGFTVVHPIPTFDNLTALDLVIGRMQELGLYLMYDMRWTYTNLSAVAEEVERIKGRPNLLLWYTADEPDGWVDPQNATLLAYETIYGLDKGYHPVSLVLNCEDYFFEEYTRGADIVMEDTYTIGNNVTFSSQWGTVCTPDYGDCGCDNCKGEFEDISTRLDEFQARFDVLGQELQKTVWGVPQAFGNDTYWKRFPTGQEFIVQSVLSINHGANGIVAWDQPAPEPIISGASTLAKAMPAMKDFILSPRAEKRQASVGRVDVAAWTVGGETLVLATNLNYEAKSVRLPEGVSGRTRQVLDAGAKLEGGKLVMESVGSGAWILG